jgi:hypothetical protein
MKQISFFRCLALAVAVAVFPAALSVSTRSVCGQSEQSDSSVGQAKGIRGSQAVVGIAPGEPDAPLRWWKGNLHTHTFWSDGNDFPEMVAAWYAERDYNFLALSDHNVLSRGLRWMPLDTIIQRSNEGVLDRYRAKFGESWVETRENDSKIEVRLKPLDEYRCLVERGGSFLMIEGEEISDSAEGKPVHMNATNLAELIYPAGGATVRESIRNNLRMVLEQEKATGRQILPHLNHPNFHYAITAADLASAVEEQFFEVYNGHPAVNHLGDADHIGVETMWDTINAMRLLVLSAEPILGIATDDSHEYHGRPGSRPGRGWVMVRSRYLTPEHLIRAMKAADFYASSGVVLEDVQYQPEQKTLSLVISPAEDASYETEFIAVMKPAEGTLANGEIPVDLEKSNLPSAQVVATVPGLSPSYRLTGRELYVRAVVNSSLPAEDPVYDGQRRQAWTQPVGWRIDGN